MTSRLLYPFAILSLPLAALSLAPDAQLARGRLFESLSSPSGKMTLSPEMVIPEPSDPTALLLQATAVTKLSEKIRAQAKANAAWIQGSTDALKSFCKEQENALGNFPGPVPVVFCPSEGCTPEELEVIAQAGASGVLITACEGGELAAIDDIKSDESFIAGMKSALEAGIQPIPEIVLSDATAASFGEDDVDSLVETITGVLGSEPASLLFTINPENEEQGEVSLPRVSKALGKKLPILGSVRVGAGEGRMGTETARFKDAGFTGAVLRSDCVPGFRMNPDLEVVGRFWSACIGDLKSLKSKNFSFRARNDLEKSVPLEWAKYQKDIMDSGALGDMSDNAAGALNSANGDHLGF
eukprot:CAMPEP_0195314216 /NCGR_PEP_ID=MMETSP0708-20121125/2265_1 /TAXON_ID=33640 /ORGANISM="Asterionellopsis glacialis, Strain CCMP134" /LENGTH=354 /DNA_ID=CAMNT_0040379171 /DNA_START=53 /DNA_END=1117 /DNA_ORIENTATION=+